MEPKIANLVLQYVQLSSALAKRAMDERAELLAAKTKSTEKVAAVVEQLLAVKRIQPGQKKQAADKLATHAGALEILGNAVVQIGELEQRTKSAVQLGVPDGEKQAGDDPNWSTTSPFVGGRTSRKKASDVALEAVLSDPIRN